MRSGLTLAALGCLSTFAFADDGWMPMNGTAGNMKGKHPTVRMVSEVVRATVHRSYASVDCNFVFTNDGPACTVTMGFPAGGEQDWELSAKELDHNILTKFLSFVNGKAVKTKHYVMGENDDPRTLSGIRQWKVKDVKFGAGQTLRVRDTYRTALGVTSMTPQWSHFYYVLSTGGTWKGNIGRADVIVTFAPDVLPGKITFASSDSFGKDADGLLVAHQDGFWSKHPNVVTWEWTPSPKVSGRSLTFTKTNWSPTEEDNIVLTFVVKK